MTTGGPPAALSMRPLQNPITLVSATPPGSRPGQATTATSHHPRSHTQRRTPPSKFALVLSWIGRTKLYLGAAIGILTLIVTIVSLLSSFAGDRYGKEALELALWTARKDYVEACQTYLNHTNVDCQHALEKGLPPPPGLDRLAARSLQKLKNHVQWLEIRPLNHKTDHHVVWLRLLFLTGTIIIAFILIREWNRFTHLVRRQLAKAWCLDGIDDQGSSFQPSAISIQSARLRAHSPSQATSTGISVKKSWKYDVREIPPGGQLISEAIAHQMDRVLARRTSRTRDRAVTQQRSE